MRSVARYRSHCVKQLDKIHHIGYMPQRRVREGGRPSLLSSHTSGRRARGSGATKTATKDMYGGFTPDDGGTFASPPAIRPSRQGRVGAFQSVNRRPCHSQATARTIPRAASRRRAGRTVTDRRDGCARKSNILVSREGTKARRDCAEPQALSHSRRCAGREEGRQPAALRPGGFLLRAFVPSCENFRRGPRGDAYRHHRPMRKGRPDRSGRPSR
jgi:hypothetical protein